MAINSIGETRNFPCVLSGLFSYIYTVLIDALRLTRCAILQVHEIPT